MFTSTTWCLTTWLWQYYENQALAGLVTRGIRTQAHGIKVNATQCLYRVFTALWYTGKQLATRTLLKASPLDYSLLARSLTLQNSLIEKNSSLFICILDNSTLTGRRREGGSAIPYVPQEFCIKVICMILKKSNGISQKGTGLRNRGRLKLVKNLPKAFEWNTDKQTLQTQVKFPCASKLWLEAEVKNSDFNTTRTVLAHKQHQAASAGSWHPLWNCPPWEQSQGYPSAQGKANNTATGERHVQKSTAGRPQD